MTLGDRNQRYPPSHLAEVVLRPILLWKGELPGEGMLLFIPSNRIRYRAQHYLAFLTVRYPITVLRKRQNKRDTEETRTYLKIV
jgi:hypothetical protein